MYISEPGNWCGYTYDSSCRNTKRFVKNLLEQSQDIEIPSPNTPTRRYNPMHYIDSKVFIQQVENGWTVRQQAKYWKCSDHAIRNRRIKYGCSTKKLHQPYIPPEQIEQLEKNFDEFMRQVQKGWSVEQLAEYWYVTIETADMYKRIAEKQQ